MVAESLAALADQTEIAGTGLNHFCPRVPDTLEETGLAETLLEQLILKVLYFRNETSGRELSSSIGLKFSVIEKLVEYLKREHLIQIRRSMGIGAVSSVFALTEEGRQHAREHLEANQYAGRAPVPLDEYATGVRAQRQETSWLTMDRLIETFRHMVVTSQMLRQVGPAVNSGKSFLIYGQPGNGKTYLAEALFELDNSEIYVPYAIESQGTIIQMFDPTYHHRVEEAEEESVMLGDNVEHDRRWFRCRRPFIVSGGELDMNMLDLSYNQVSKFYDAPLQMKANNGIYLIDDFGRQRVSPAEVLNRWIVPMERRVDYLTFENGTKMTAPFETFLIFSTNLQPSQLGDEAFLRRIQYKMLMKNPDEGEFQEIFERFAAAKRIPFEPAVLEGFLDRHYRTTGRAKRRCHPRDVLIHAIDLIHFEAREWRLTTEVLDLAFESCFADHGED